MSRETTSRSPDWDALYAVAEGQQGLFTTQQAAAAGYSPQLLHKYLESGKISRVRRGIYRLVHFPAAEHEDLVMLWLWTGQDGVFSHETALSLHELSDVLPAKVHMIVPAAWRKRRLRIPEGLVLHFVDLEQDDVWTSGPLPVTTPKRTLKDVIETALSPDLVDQAIRQAVRRGLISPDDETELLNEPGFAA